MKKGRRAEVASTKAAAIAGKDIDALRHIFGENGVECSDQILAHHSHDQVSDSRYWNRPAVVVYPTETAQVSALMQWAYRTNIPVTPCGARSGLSGGAIPVPHGVVCNFTRMNRIVEIDAGNLMAVVEPGVVTNKLDDALSRHGLFFAGYPMSEDICTIGGNVAENAGGGRAIKYGTTINYVCGAEVVLPTGEIITLGGKYLKDVTGYNLLHLLIGSEGTLGMFTQLTIRAIPRPQSSGVLFAAFSDSHAATAMVSSLKTELSVSPSAIEYIDGNTALHTNMTLPPSRRLTLPEGMDAFLLIEFDDAQEAAPHLSEARSHIAARGGTICAVGTTPDEIERAWRLRKGVAWWCKKIGQGYDGIEDVVVPPTAVPALVAFTDTLRKKYEVPIALFGHSGDGNFHVNPIKPPEMEIENWYEVEHALLIDLYREVKTLGGTISGEHGIGRKRVQYLSLFLSDDTIRTMRAIKQALDPRNLLNPGVIFEKRSAPQS